MRNSKVQSAVMAPEERGLTSKRRAPCALLSPILRTVRVRVPVLGSWIDLHVTELDSTCMQLLYILYI